MFIHYCTLLYKIKFRQTLLVVSPNGKMKSSENLWISRFSDDLDPSTPIGEISSITIEFD